MNMNIRYPLSVLLIAFVFSYGTFSYLKWRDRDLWQSSERTVETGQGISPEEQNELDILRAEAEERLHLATTTIEDLSQLGALRLEAEKRLETEKTTVPQQTTTQTINAQQTTQEQTLEQRREEAMKRLLGQ